MEGGTFTHGRDICFQEPRYIKGFIALYWAFERGLNPVFDDERAGVVCLLWEEIYTARTGV